MSNLKRTGKYISDQECACEVSVWNTNIEDIVYEGGVVVEL